MNVESSLPIYPDLSGAPLQNGVVYYGGAGLNPVTSPTTVYWDAAGTQPAGQPITVANGMPTRNGVPARVWIPGDYSRLVLDAKGRTVVYEPTVFVSSSASALSAPGGSSLVGFMSSIVGAVARLMSQKAGEWVSPEDAGAAANGIADDTTAIQKALNAGGEIRFTPGRTYIIDGPLIASVAGTRIRARGATIKLKANAASKGMLRLQGTGCEVFGGTWDGNKANGNQPADFSTSWGVSVEANGCRVIGAASINTFGMFVTGGSVSDTLIEKCTINNTTGYGIFLSTGVDAFRNRAIGNVIDMSEGGIFGQGILFTRNGTVAYQYDWELRDNMVNGSQAAGMLDQGINLAVRGHRGIVANNRTKYGAMGFSEGGDYTVITGNIISDLVGNTRYGVEVSGTNVCVTGNTITGAIRGVTGSSALMDGMTISGNVFQGCTNDIWIRPSTGGTARYLNISGNTFRHALGSAAIYLASDCTFSHIAANNLVGPGSGTAGGRAVYLDGVGGSVSIMGNRLSGWERAVGLFNGTAMAFSNVTFNGNDVSNAVILTANGWLNPEGSATIGAACVQMGNIEASGLVREFVDTLNLVIRRFGTGSPETVIAAGIGSLYFRTNGGAATTLYVKESGTGNTGWIAK